MNSQGAQLVHNAAKKLSAGVVAKISSGKSLLCSCHIHK